MSQLPPVESGAVDRDGVRIDYEVHGTGSSTLVLLPAWMIVDRHLWRAQVAGLARHHRVVTYDARGAGRSDRPVDPDAYAIGEHVADLTAVLDVTATQRAVVVGNSFGGILAYVSAASLPDRIVGMVLIGGSVDLLGDTAAPLHVALATFHDERPDDAVWSRYNRRAWDRDFEGFARWFSATALPETHAAQAREDALDRALDNTPEVLAATIAIRAATHPAVNAERLRALSPMIRCPTLVVHGGLDEVAPRRWGQLVAETLDAPFIELGDAGHCPHVTFPMRVNRLIRDFVAAGVAGPVPTSTSPERTDP